jgi:hypothetical protein
MTRPLTARGVKAMLTRAGIDHSELQIGEDPVVWTDVETGKRSTYVIICGPADVRRQASDVLFDRGVSSAPYPDHDSWARPGGSSKLNDTAKATLRDAGISHAAWFRANGYQGTWGGDSCGCPDDRCIGFHHTGPDNCRCLPALLAGPGVAGAARKGRALASAMRTGGRTTAAGDVEQDACDDPDCAGECKAGAFR